MKLAVVGCGAVGSFYGAKLCQAGHPTHFLLRSDYEAVRAHGVVIQSCDGDFHVHPFCARTPEAIGPVDLVLIGLKTTANDQLPRLLPPLVGPQTMIMTLQNGLGNEDHLAAICGPNNILCGLCFVCLNRVSPGVIRHLAHGRVVVGEYRRAPLERTRSLARLFQEAGVPCKVADDLARAHWEKLIWNVPFNGLGVAGVAGYDAVIRGELLPGSVLGPCLTTDVLLKAPHWEKLTRELMLEVIHTAQALGFGLVQEMAQKNVALTLVMGAYKASTLLDYERGLPLELESLFLEPLRCAQNCGVPTPRLAAMCAVLQQLDASRQIESVRV